MAPTALPTANPVSLSATTATIRTSQSSCLHNIAFLKNDGSNFTTWKFRISRVLIQCGLWKIVSGQEQQP
ncbi:hypothetical protein BD413DRAFT_478147, partial [Trametes elegans]